MHPQSRAHTQVQAYAHISVCVCVRLHAYEPTETANSKFSKFRAKHGRNQNTVLLKLGDLIVLGGSYYLFPGKLRTFSHFWGGGRGNPTA